MRAIILIAFSAVIVGGMSSCNTATLDPVTQPKNKHVSLGATSADAYLQQELAKGTTFSTEAEKKAFSDYIKLAYKSDFEKDAIDKSSNSERKH